MLFSFFFSFYLFFSQCTVDYQYSHWVPMCYGSLVTSGLAQRSAVSTQTKQSDHTLTKWNFLKSQTTNLLTDNYFLSCPFRIEQSCVVRWYVDRWFSSATLTNQKRVQSVSEPLNSPRTDPEEKFMASSPNNPWWFLKTSNITTRLAPCSCCCS